MTYAVAVQRPGKVNRAGGALRQAGMTSVLSLLALWIAEPCGEKRAVPCLLRTTLISVCVQWEDYYCLSSDLLYQRIIR